MADDNECILTEEEERLIEELCDDGTVWVINNNTPLTYDDYSNWAAYPYWNLHEAILLLLDINPKSNKKYNTSIEESIATGRRYCHVFEMLQRGINSNSLNKKMLIRYLSPDSDSEDETDAECLGFRPQDIVTWYRNNGFNVPSKLYAAVMDPHITRPHAAIDSAQQVVQTETSNDSPEQNARKHLPQVCSIKSRSTFSDEGIIQPKRGEKGARAKWNRRQPYLDFAEEFMKTLLDLECKCRHDILAKITYECAQHDGKPLSSYDRPGWGLKNAMKTIAMKLLPADRILGNQEYTEAAKSGNIRECPISDHFLFKHRRK